MNLLVFLILERYNSHLIHYDVELDHEKNPRQSKACERVEITGTGKGPTMRAEARGPDFYTALDAAVGKLEARLRRSHDRRVHHGRHQPTSVATATAPLAATDPGAHQHTTTNPLEHTSHERPGDGYHWVHWSGERGSHRAGQGAPRRTDDHRPGPLREGTGRPRLLPPTRPAPQMTRMFAWADVDGLRLEAARVILGERSLRASGSLVSTRQDGTEAYCASYSLATDETGVAQRLTVRTTRAQDEQYVTLTRSEEGIWLVDHEVDQGASTVRTTFSGALDVNLAFSPLFNALPVRRLGLHRAAAEHDLPMVFVSLPGLEVGCTPQTYRTVSVGETTVVSFASDVFTAELTVDADGLVLSYPGLTLRT